MGEVSVDRIDASTETSIFPEALSVQTQTDDEVDLRLSCRLYILGQRGLFRRNDILYEESSSD